MALDGDNFEEELAREEISESHFSGVFNRSIQHPEVRFALSREDMGVDGQDDREIADDRVLNSGLVFVPSLSSLGTIAVKNPLLKPSNDSNDNVTLKNKFLHNFIYNQKHKRISLIEIIFLVC